MTKSIRNRSWRRISVHGIYGYFLADGKWSVEVIRTDSACKHWSTFCYLDGKILQRAGVGKVSERMAKSEAKKWLRKRVLETNLAHAPGFNHNDPTLDNNDDPKEW